jgi:hypothetical protein
MWISPRGWQSALADLRSAGLSSFARKGSQQASMLHVTALVGGRAAPRVLTVRPGPGTPPVGSPSEYRLLARDTVGRVIATAPMAASTNLVHGAGAATLLRGQVAADGAASIEVVRDGVVVATRVRTTDVPHVTVLSPRAGTRVGRGRTVSVRWRAVDADGGALATLIDYSVDGGRTWRTIYSGEAEGAASLPSSLFARSGRARLRLRVSDGFNVASTTSSVFRAAGRPPAVRIQSPISGQRLRGDSMVYLEGSAYDDAGRPIPAGRLTWVAGRRVLGHGRQVSTQLAPGPQAIRLVARDRSGRAGSAVVHVRVTSVAPHVLDVRLPAALRRSAHRLTFRLATTIPATATVGGKRFRLGRALRTLSVAVAPGRATLRLPLRLEASGRVTRSTIVVARR